MVAENLTHSLTNFHPHKKLEMRQGWSEMVSDQQLKLVHIFSPGQVTHLLEKTISIPSFPLNLSAGIHQVSEKSHASKNKEYWFFMLSFPDLGPWKWSQDKALETMCVGQCWSGRLVVQSTAVQFCLGKPQWRSKVALIGADT